ncbi:HAD-IC family P-type ATPase, partial [Candidatus Gottesmanbacteria bacterium]|nr:HAD-IC family P-type ATPase [Candidatus Gottesmanbacteria bacterium]
MTGLTSQEAQERLKEFGLNILPEKPPPSSFLIFLDQFKSPLVYVLLFAAGVTLFLRNFPDMAIILLAVFINTILGFYQERKASRALFALKKILTPMAWVLRGDRRQLLETRFLVPGDLVFLTAGDKVPADGVLKESFHLSLNEAILTGEANPLTKRVGEKIFMGTTVLAGRAVFKAEETGKNSQIGKIAEKLTKLEEEKTPLELRLSGFARQLVFFVAGSTIFIFLTGILLGKNWTEMFTTSVAIAVAAIPEGLVVSLTVILAIGMQRILSRKALVRRLLAAETLGSVTVIAADKTGTLTEGVMKVVKTDFADNKRALEACALANNLADPLEVALWEYGQKEGLDPQKITEENRRIDEWPFSPERRLAAYLYPGRLFVSGAPEVILEKSRKDQRNWKLEIRNWGEEGLRMIALAEKKVDAEKIREKDLGDFDFLGLVGFADPPRVGVGEVIKEAQRGGIKIKVITGDFRATSEVVLAKLGIKLSPEQIMEGKELENIPQEELVRKIDNLVLFARVTPSQKFKIVEALKEKGEVVAILGDGVNDA